MVEAPMRPARQREGSHSPEEGVSGSQAVSDFPGSMGTGTCIAKRERTI